MNKIMLLMAAFMLMAGAAFAPSADTETKGGKVLCCHDGKCDTEHTLMECAKLGGKVVKDCKKCK